MPGLLASCKDIQASLESEEHALRQCVCSTSLPVGRLIVDKPDILLKTGTTRTISVSVCVVWTGESQNTALTRVITSAADQKHPQ
jgi:hypothetical protein